MKTQTQKCFSLISEPFPTWFQIHFQLDFRAISICNSESFPAWFHSHFQHEFIAISSLISELFTAWFQSIYHLISKLFTAWFQTIYHLISKLFTTWFQSHFQQRLLNETLYSRQYWINKQRKNDRLLNTSALSFCVTLILNLIYLLPHRQ